MRAMMTGVANKFKGGTAGDPIIAAYYRIHERNSSFPPDVPITNTSSLVYASTTSSIAEMITLFHVDKTDIDGKRMYIDWGATFRSSSALTRKLSIYDGHILGDDAQFVNGSAIPTSTNIVTHAATDNGPSTESTLVPDLSSFSASITIMVYFLDGWDGDAITGTLNTLELRETNETLIKTFNFLGDITETGTSAGSSFGTFNE